MTLQNFLSALPFYSYLSINQNHILLSLVITSKQSNLVEICSVAVLSRYILPWTLNSNVQLQKQLVFSFCKCVMMSDRWIHLLV